jgi:protoporphyrinogen oxidase
MKKVLVIGGGLSGIGAATALQESGIEYELHEMSDFLGGKLESSKIDGFTLDRGFQVFFDAYRRDMPALNLKFGKFKQGALLCYDGQAEPIDKFQPLVTVLSPAFTLKDKLLTLKLTRDAVKWTQKPPEQTIRDFCSSYGFSDNFIERFAVPFWGGITLDRTLSQSASKLIKSWSHLSKGPAMLPEGGMQGITSHLSKSLKSVHLNSKIEGKLESTKGFIVTINGVEREFDRIISSIPWSDSADNIVWLSSCAIWFKCPTPPIMEPFLILNSNPNAFVNTIAPISLAQPSYAPKGSHLVCVAIVNHEQLSDSEMVKRALEDVQIMFPKGNFEGWEMIRVDWIRKAQISETPISKCELFQPPGFTIIGERVTGSRINDVYQNGYRTGKNIANG